MSVGTHYFDIRPVISSANNYPGHYIDNVNEFTSSNNEHIALYLPNIKNTDEGYSPVNDDEWAGILHPFWPDLNYLWAVNCFTICRFSGAMA
ncbi:uncharacterized protein Z518_01376 [Rhinocladiella mackenziei CBS 650.93]|uniref:Rhinocladiella mackenziei CBS 650.93 unplaced genomic scaffold supercont1.1, whole genome shotgun sequence n=1 Tax=Rhinocladiella mackenziei CBS 650.93 TaxID=1442369 RepID=A0A0D2IW71_9EURO|nr:uncharacterized protein Z518_01376 [Rhinocladiella mackenziei CBS 650.93]KIX10294.1 hypothetical protein Z518_01376 [Rhinocladiella mackenziei CBS 650.93]